MIDLQLFEPSTAEISQKKGGSMRKGMGRCVLFLRVETLVILMASLYGGGAVADAPAPGGEEVTYSTTIKPLLDGHCMECHHTGGRLPDFTQFPFRSDKTADQEVIVDKILVKVDGPKGEMPPGARIKLTDSEIDLIRVWRQTGLNP